ncbi:hypothetical protein EFR24_00530, partial [Lactobacillus delbrueckii subsp. lactis]|nr:hypothetical protein [Lactobacillus delbrueckii subsp. lactis]
IIAITSSLIEYLLAKLLSFQGFIVLFGVGSLSNNGMMFTKQLYQRKEGRLCSFLILKSMLKKLKKSAAKIPIPGTTPWP